MIRVLWIMCLRRLKPLFQKPVAIIMSMFQSIIWLVLFGSLFSGARGAETVGGSYIAYMLPGILTMNALFIGIYLGLGTISDLLGGVLQRFLVAPIGKYGVIFSDLMYLVILQLMQSTVLIALSLLLGAGVEILWAVAVYIVVPLVLAASMGSLSIATTLITKKHSSMITMMQFCSLPMMFLSSALLPQESSPDWMRIISKVNPVEWAIRLERFATTGHGASEWLPYALLFAGFAVASVIFCMFTLDRYRRSL